MPAIAEHRAPRSRRRGFLLAIGAAIVAAWLAVLAREGPPSSLAYYRFLTGDELRTADIARYDWVVVKGTVTSRALQEVRLSHPHLKLANYEQAAALNRREAAYARARGWLALTCPGAEIHPVDIAQVTLMDLTNPAARAWRAKQIAEETRASAYDASYLDTLRSFYPPEFYDGVHCIDDLDARWLRASIELLRLVKARTDKMVIANGAGLQSGRNYFGHQPAAQRLVAAADAVQIEHFFRRPQSYDDDRAFLQRLVDEGERVFVKVDGDADEAASSVAGLRGVFLNVDD